jgi:hypothetical protein
VALYRLSETPPLSAPVVVTAFDGWVDAAGVATAAARHLAGEGAVVAAFDTDALLDYRVRRPVLDIMDGTLTELRWPELAIRRSSVGGRDLLVLSGPEPDFRWRELAEAALDLSLRLGVVEWVSLGAIPAAVPHTRPVPILGTASKPGLLRDDVVQGPQGLLRVPSAALSVVELSVSEGGIPAVGFYAQVPHYVNGPYPAATVALLAHVEQHLGIGIPLGSLPDEVVTHQARLDAALEEDEEARAYVRRLETLLGEERIPSGDELASEIERFLRDAGPGRDQGRDVGREGGTDPGEPPGAFDGG